MLVVSAMARPGRELAEAHRPQLSAQGLLGNPDAVPMRYVTSKSTPFSAAQVKRFLEIIEATRSINSLPDSIAAL